MSRQREAEIVEELAKFKGQAIMQLFVELLSSRRKRYRDKLEKGEDYRLYAGKAQECRDLSIILK